MKWEGIWKSLWPSQDKNSAVDLIHFRKKTTLYSFYDSLLLSKYIPFLMCYLLSLVRELAEVSLSPFLQMGKQTLTE